MTIEKLERGKEDNSKMKSQAVAGRYIQEHEYFTLMNEVFDAVDFGWGTTGKKDKIKKLFEKLWELEK